MVVPALTCWPGLTGMLATTALTWGRSVTAFRELRLAMKSALCCTSLGARVISLTFAGGGPGGFDLPPHAARPKTSRLEASRRMRSSGPPYRHLQPDAPALRRLTVANAAMSRPPG